MSDELVSGLIPKAGLRVLHAQLGDIARGARTLSGLAPASAGMLAEGLCAAAILGALQKTDARINLQLECDGPLRGMFLDANAQGQLRGYVKNRQVGFTGDAGAFHYRPVLGNRGFISVLRDLGEGEYYRSAVELRHFDLARDLEEYFLTSDQVESRLVIATVGDASEPLGLVGALLLQKLPDGDASRLEAIGAELRQGRLAQALQVRRNEGAAAVLRDLFDGDELEVMSRFPLSFSCSCSKDRVLRALAAIGREELQDVLEKDGKAEVDCEFCTAHYVVGPDELRALLAQSE